MLVILGNFKLENIPQNFDFSIRKIQLFILKAVVKSVFSSYITISPVVTNFKELERGMKSEKLQYYYLLLWDNKGPDQT